MLFHSTSINPHAICSDPIPLVNVNRYYIDLFISINDDTPQSCHLALMLYIFGKRLTLTANIT